MSNSQCPRDTALCTVLGQGSDGQGHLFSVVAFRTEIRLGDDGQSFTGTFVASISNRGGDMMANFPGTLEAVRIIADAPAMPHSAVLRSEWIGREDGTSDLIATGG